MIFLIKNINLINNIMERSDQYMLVRLQGFWMSGNQDASCKVNQLELSFLEENKRSMNLNTLLDPRRVLSRYRNWYITHKNTHLPSFQCWNNCTDRPQIMYTDSYNFTCTANCVPASQISLLFRSTRTIGRFRATGNFETTASNTFELQAIWDQLLQMTPKWHWTIQGQKYPIYLSLVSRGHKFNSISLYD